MIQLQQITKIYPQNNTIAIQDVSLQIHRGEIFGIIGYSGAGKSTLLRTINQLEKQSSGSVIIDGQRMEQLSKKELLKTRKKIGMIFQHFNLLWSRTVFDNIALPLELEHHSNAYINEKVTKLIQLVGLTGKESSFPSTLSGGQKQRVAIARALVNDPKILLCDEATSALDPDTTCAILELLKKINTQLQVSIVLITHQMEVVQKICDRVAIMDSGFIRQVGTVEAIFHPSHSSTQPLPSVIQHNYLPGSLLKIQCNQASSYHNLYLELQQYPSLKIIYTTLVDTPQQSYGILYIENNANNEHILNQLHSLHMHMEVI